MAIKDSLRRALVFSGLVDDSEPGTPDYLTRPEPEPLPVDPPVPPAPEPAWASVPEQPAPEAPPPAYHGGEAGPIVVRRIGGPDDDPGWPASAQGDPWATPGPAIPTPAPAPPADERAATPSPTREVPVHRVLPRSFNDAQTLADRFKAGAPVVLDLQGVETDLAKRLIGFASGLTYGLDGSMERLEGRVFLLVPIDVEMPAGQRARLAAQGSLNRA